MHINLLIIFLYVTKNGNNYMSQPRYFSGKHPISSHTNADKANHLPCADLTWEAAARSAWRRTMGLRHQAVFGGRQGTMTRTPKMCTKSKLLYDLPERHLHTISAKFNCLASNLRENIIRCFFSMKKLAANTSQQHPCGKRMPHARERQRKVMVEFDPLRNPFAPTWGNTKGKNIDLKNLQP